MRYLLFDSSTSKVVVEADTIDAVAEVKVELRDSGAPIDALVILEHIEGDEFVVVNE